MNSVEPAKSVSIVPTPVHQALLQSAAATLSKAAARNQCRVRLHAAQTESITGTSTNTPTTVASAAPESAPKRAIATATASSKKLLAPISALEQRCYGAP